jgi:hypothetical protein
MPVPIVQEAGRAPGPVWTSAVNFAHNGIRSLDRPASSYTNYAIPAHTIYIYEDNNSPLPKQFY